MSRTAIMLGLSFLITAVFILALRPVAYAAGLVDRPGGRKMHNGVIPVIGGLAMLPGIAVSSLVSPFTELQLVFCGALLLVAIVGAIDDRFDLPAGVRLLAQTCAVLLMVGAGNIQVTTLGTFSGMDVELGALSVAFTLLVAMSAINAFNMFDGSDGVAGGQALVGALILAAICGFDATHASMPLLLGVVGAIAAFLLFNWPSKRTVGVRCFMGDAGSTMLGFALAWLSIQITQGPAAVMSPVVILWIFALPIYDFFSSMVRRAWSGRSPFHGDSEHLHHILRRLGLSSRRVAQLILLGAAVFGMLGIAGYRLGLPDMLLFTLWLGVGAGYHIVFGTNQILSRRVRHMSQEPVAKNGVVVWHFQRRRKLMILKAKRSNRAHKAIR